MAADESNDTKKILMTHALQLLGLRQQSEKELRRKLADYARRALPDLSESAIEPVIDRLKEQHYVDDLAFARWYAEQRSLHRPRSKRVLRQELFSKGLDEEVMNTALDEYDEEAACRALAQKRGHYPMKKLMQNLAREGFPWDIIRDVCGQ